tara:strand:+ start:258 stop:542 length:285 start_codon:yes stop_codon:yes gene_type:complete
MIDIKIHEDTVRTVNEFLVSNEQFGDDWREEKSGLNNLLAEVKGLDKVIRVIDKEGVCIEEYKSWEEAARAFCDMLNDLEHDTYELVAVRRDEE